MQQSSLTRWVGRHLAVPAIGLIGLAAAAPAQAAFPGAPGPIAYSYSNFTETGGSGGLRAHGPRKWDGNDGSHVGAPAWGPRLR